MPTRILVHENDDDVDDDNIQDNNHSINMSHCSDDNHHYYNNNTAGTSGILWCHEHLPCCDRPPQHAESSPPSNLLTTAKNKDSNNSNSNDMTNQQNYHVGMETQQLLLGFSLPHHSSATTATTKYHHHHHSPKQEEASNNMEENDHPHDDDDEKDHYPARSIRQREESFTQMVLDQTREPDRIPLLPIQPPRPPRIMGRNEIEYRDQYQSVVARVVVDTATHVPYASLTRDEQVRAQQFVTDLLQRLGVASGHSSRGSHHLGRDDERLTLPHSLDHTPHDDALQLWSSPRPTTQDPNFDMVETSLDLFASPVTATHDNLHNHNHPPQLDAPRPSTTTTNSAPSSVEITRAARHGHDDDDDGESDVTPPPQEKNDPHCKKRYASTSGKRGADLVRLRRHEERDDDDDMVVFHPPSPSQFLVRAIDRLSVMDQTNNNIDDDDDDPIDIFSSSQSPIVAAAADTNPFTTTAFDRSPATTNRGNNLVDHHHHHRRTTSMESIEADGISFHVGDNNDNSSDGSSISCGHESTMPTNPVPPQRGNDYDSLVETTMLLDTQQVHWDYDHTLVKNAPTDVRLRQGETIRYPKLTVQRRSRTRPTGSTIAPVGLTQLYPDPFRGYDDIVQQQLNRFYAKLTNQNRRTMRRRCGAILSMTEQQVTDVVLKLHLDHAVMCDVTEHPNQSVPLRGKTLIMTRSKDELDMWRRAFREGSGLSIVNHASMPLAQRKHPTLPAKLVHYDIVLSTYDAIKSPDMAIKVDSTTGLAMAHVDHTTSDGWYTTITTASTKQSQHRSGDNEGKNQPICKALSAVHKLHWSRIILVDVLGRKGYLTKADTTARLQAVRALNADLRWAFFVVSDLNGGDQTNTNCNTNKNAKSAVDSAQTLLCERNTLLSLASTLRHPASGDDDVDIDQIRQEIVYNFDM